jgi:hypothetical protein
MWSIMFLLCLRTLSVRPYGGTDDGAAVNSL